MWEGRRAPVRRLGLTPKATSPDLGAAQTSLAGESGLRSQTSISEGGPGRNRYLQSGGLSPRTQTSRKT
jgi:hypothetical protein